MLFVVYGKEKTMNATAVASEYTPCFCQHVARLVRGHIGANNVGDHKLTVQEQEEPLLCALRQASKGPKIYARSLAVNVNFASKDWRPCDIDASYLARKSECVHAQCAGCCAN